MDDEIATDQITAEGYLIALALSSDGDEVTVGNLRISFDRLAMLLRRLYTLATLLADYHDPNQPNTAIST